MLWYHTKIVVFMMLLGLQISVTVAIAQQNAQYGALRPALFLFKTGNISKAAETWMATGRQSLENSRSTAALRLAGLAYVLATIALEKNFDAKAYESWGQAIKCFLEGKTQWEQERKVLKDKIGTLMYEINSAGSGAGQPIVNDEDLLLLDFEKDLGITAYNGPKPGLKSKSERGRNKAHITVNRDYNPRPKTVIQEEQQAQEVKSRYASQDTVLDTQTITANETHLGRGLSVVSVLQNEILPSEPVVLPDSAAIHDTSDTAIEIPALKNNTSDTIKSSLQVAAPPVEQRIIAHGVQAGAFFRQDSAGENAETNRRTDNSIPVQISRRSMPFSPVEDETPKNKAETQAAVEANSLAYLGLTRRDAAFSDAELSIARAAWNYLVANRQRNTGMFNAVNGYTFTTMWDMGSALAGLVAAEQLGIINLQRFEKDMGLLLETLTIMPLYNNELPNREYHTQTGEMVDLKNRPSHKGSGWSALDIGRFLIWLKIVANWYPDFEEKVNKIFNRCKFTRLSKNQEMNGILFNGRAENDWQEGRLGYEQYAAAGFGLWGIYLGNALSLENTDTVVVSGVRMLYDNRGMAYLNSEPFFLAMMEVGIINPAFNELAQRIYLVQKKRAQELDMLIAVSEDAISQSPWFVYNCILYNNKPWFCVSHNGKPKPALKTLSTKAAFAWSVLFQDVYAEKLRNKVENLTHPARGYFAGVFESGATNKSLNINTNAVILEAMLFLGRGRKPFMPFDARELTGGAGRSQLQASPAIRR